MIIPEKYCIVDIETATNREPNANTDILRYVGFKSCSGNYRIYNLDNSDNIQLALDSFDYIIGHNITNYDYPILLRYNFSTKAIIIDTYEIIDRRAKSMMYLDLNKGDRSLEKLCELFNLPTKKKTFDYSLLNKDRLTTEEYKLLEEYLICDLDATDELFKYLYEFFYGFRELVNKKDLNKMLWLTSRVGTIAYKIICNQANLPEVYDNSKEDSIEPKYEGAYVSDPYTDYIE